jgi:hypothetical protein
VGLGLGEAYLYRGPRDALTILLFSGRSAISYGDVPRLGLGIELGLWRRATVRVRDRTRGCGDVPRVCRTHDGLIEATYMFSRLSYRRQ